jgi:hypothetical protein
MQIVSNKVVSKIYGHGRGWIFTPKDIAGSGNPKAVERALARLKQKGTIRLILRGVYDYPKFSTLFNAPASPEPHKIAEAIARKYGWSIIPSGETALNLFGLSTQVPAHYIYYSDGPSKKYSWVGGELIFIKRANKETSTLSPKTALVVQALKTLGKDNVDSTVLKRIEKALTAKEKVRALREAQFTASWIYEITKKIAAKGA